MKPNVGALLLFLLLLFGLSRDKAGAAPPAKPPELGPIPGEPTPAPAPQPAPKPIPQPPVGEPPEIIPPEPKPKPEPQPEPTPRWTPSEVIIQFPLIMCLDGDQVIQVTWPLRLTDVKAGTAKMDLLFADVGIVAQTAEFAFLFGEARTFRLAFSPSATLFKVPGGGKDFTFYARLVEGDVPIARERRTVTFVVCPSPDTLSYTLTHM